MIRLFPVYCLKPAVEEIVSFPFLCSREVPHCERVLLFQAKQANESHRINGLQEKPHIYKEVGKVLWKKY